MADHPYQPPNSAEAVSPLSKIPIWFWIVAIVALLWNLMGLMAFFADMMMSEEALANLPEAQQTLYKSAPIWTKIAFAVAVIGGVMGSIGLLVRAKWAFPVFVLSLLGVLAQQTYIYFLSDTVKVLGLANLVLPILVLVIAILLVVFSKQWISKGILR